MYQMSAGDRKPAADCVSAENPTWGRREGSRGVGNAKIP